MQRVPAGEIELVVVEKMRGILRSPEVLAHAVISPHRDHHSTAIVTD